MTLIESRRRLLFEVVFLGLYTNWMITAFEKLTFNTNLFWMSIVQYILFFLSIFLLLYCFTISIKRKLGLLVMLLQPSLVYWSLHISFNILSIESTLESLYYGELSFMILGLFLWTFIIYMHISERKTLTQGFIKLVQLPPFLSKMHVLELYHNYSFWIKNTLSFILIVDTLLLKIKFEKIPFTILCTIWIANIIPLMFLFIVGSIPIIKYLLNVNLPQNDRRELSKEINELAKKMQVDFTHYYRLSNTNNAGVFRNKVFIGDRTEAMMSESELTAVMAHEFSHKTKKKNHDLVFAFGGFITLCVTLVIIRGLPKTLGIFLIPSCFYLLFHQFAWYRELDCDENAVKYVPTEDLQNALIKFAEGKIHTYSFLHPSIWYRVQNLARTELYGIKN